MTDPRDAFLEKFRASLRARVQKLRDMLEILQHMPESQDAAAQVLGELHTLKGESRLLGLERHSVLAHTLETILTQVNATTIAAAEFALEVVARSLQDNVTRENADLMVAAALQRLEGGVESFARDAAAPQTPTIGGTDPSDQVVPAVAAGSGRWVQVDAKLIDELCDMMASITGDFGRIFSGVTRLGVAARETRGVIRQTSSLLAEECTRFRSALDNAAVRTWELRMVPVQPLLRELSNHAQELAAAADKEVRIDVDAGSVQIERDALDKVWDAMLHLVRNSIDHGLENAIDRGSKGALGRLSIAAKSVGTSVVLSVEDDGRGIDAARVRQAAVNRGLIDAKRAEALGDDDVVQLLFERGFSTRENVSEISGRGVGLDVVKARAEALGGRVDVHSQHGLGTRFSITLPFTLTKERILVFELGGGLYGLPARMVQVVVGWRDFPPKEANARQVLRLEEGPVPLRSLCELLGREPEPCEAALVVSIQDQLYGLLVARAIGERELIRRPVETLLARTTDIGASAMMEDGRAVLILDLVRVGRKIRQSVGTRVAASPVQLGANKVAQVLLVDDSPIIRAMVSEILASAGLQVTTANNGEEALAKIQESEPDLVVSDIEMPRMDGFTLLEQIRRRTQRLPVVMLTTRASVQDRQRATTLGANAYVLKEDFRSDVLLDVVKRFVPLHR